MVVKAGPASPWHLRPSPWPSEANLPSVSLAPPEASQLPDGPTGMPALVRTQLSSVRPSAADIIAQPTIPTMAVPTASSNPQRGHQVGHHRAAQVDHIRQAPFGRVAGHRLGQPGRLQGLETLWVYLIAFCSSPQNANTWRQFPQLATQLTFCCGRKMLAGRSRSRRLRSQQKGSCRLGVLGQLPP